MVLVVCTALQDDIKDVNQRIGVYTSGFAATKGRL